VGEKRLVQLKTGQRVWIELSDGDILRCIGQIDSQRWREMVRMRMGGASVDELWRRQSKLSLDEFRKGLAIAFGIVDRYKWVLAEQRAGVQVLAQGPAPSAAQLARMMDR
jgi:hypothetical protein